MSQQEKTLLKQGATEQMQEKWPPDPKGVPWLKFDLMENGESGLKCTFCQVFVGGNIPFQLSSHQEKMRAIKRHASTKMHINKSQGQGEQTSSPQQGQEKQSTSQHQEGVKGPTLILAKSSGNCIGPPFQGHNFLPISNTPTVLSTLAPKMPIVIGSVENKNTVSTNSKDVPENKDKSSEITIKQEPEEPESDDRNIAPLSVCSVVLEDIEKCTGITLEQEYMELFPKDTHICKMNCKTNSFNEVEMNGELMLKCSSKEKFKIWLKKFQNKTLSTFVFVRSYPVKGHKTLFKGCYMCHRRNHQRKRKKQPKTMEIDCKATIMVYISRNREEYRCRATNQHIHPSELQTKVKLDFNHNHSIKSAESLQYRRPTKKVNERLKEDFQIGFTAPDAFARLRNDLQEKYGDSFQHVAEDRSICPDLRYIQQLFHRLRKQEGTVRKYKPRSMKKADNGAETGLEREENKKPGESTTFNQQKATQGFEAKPMQQIGWEQAPKQKPTIDPIATKCFCGLSGNWYERMLECQRCKRWIHEKCVGCLQYKLICGDRFYLYVCEFCNNGMEFIHRLPIDWDNIVHLALWNLSNSKSYSGNKNGRYFEYEEQIASWVNSHWALLQCPPELQTIPIKDRTQHILLALEGNSVKFKCGKEVRKKSSIWALKVPVPPSVLEIILPPERPITKAMLHHIRYCERTTELTPIPKTFKVDAVDPVMPMLGSPNVDDLHNEDDKVSNTRLGIQGSSSSYLVNEDIGTWNYETSLNGTSQLCTQQTPNRTGPHAQTCTQQGPVAHHLSEIEHFHLSEFLPPPTEDCNKTDLPAQMITQGGRKADKNPNFVQNQEVHRQHQEFQPHQQQHQQQQQQQQQQHQQQQQQRTITNQTIYGPGHSNSWNSGIHQHHTNNMRTLTEVKSNQTFASFQSITEDESENEIEPDLDNVHENLPEPNIEDKNAKIEEAKNNIDSALNILKRKIQTALENEVTTLYPAVKTFEKNIIAVQSHDHLVSSIINFGKYVGPSQEGGSEINSTFKRRKI